MDLSKLFNQTAVYWGSPVADAFGGYTFDSPVEVLCRWEERMERFANSTGEDKVSQAVVYSETDMAVGGYLFLGKLADLNTDMLPQTQERAFIIQAYLKTPNIKASQHLRKAWL